MTALSASAQRVQEALDAAGVTTRIVEYDVPARTSAEAAAVLGCMVGQIAKSLVFRSASGTPVLVIASGAHRVDEAKVATLAGEAIGKADAAFVRTATGYAIGGIPPLGWITTLRATRFDADSPSGAALRAHATPALTFIDRNLLAYETVYAAGGTPHAMFPITPAELVRVAQGTVADTAP
jgi:prolyl-tRNA editing enzyme YbaK/EbsC (Cys-tRNA(Pro) deacylase)